MSWLRRVLGRGSGRGEPGAGENAQECHPPVGQPPREMSGASPADHSSGISGRPANGEAAERGPAHGVGPDAPGAAHRGDVRPSAGAGWDDDGRFRVLFVCTANICRSAYADVVARGAGVPGLAFASAGTHALGGRPMDPPMAELAASQGDPAAHQARRLSRDLVAEADLILAMDGGHRRYILEEWPEFGPKTFLFGHAARKLADPPPGLALDEVAPHLWRHRDARPGDEVEDPYGRGDAAARAAADHIDALLAAVLPALSAAAPPTTSA